MNRRINELREQARTLVSTEERERGEVYDARAQWDRIDQKFAELIIQECMQVSMDSVGLDAEYEAWYLIGQHFGVSK